MSPHNLQTYRAERMASRKQVLTGCLMGFTLLSILFFATSNYSFSFSFSANSHPLKLDSGDMSGKYFAYEDVEEVAVYRGSEGDVEEVAVYRGSEGAVVPDVLTPAPERVDEEEEGREFPQLDMTPEPATTPTTATTATSATSETTATTTPTTESTTPTTEPTSTSEPESDLVEKRGAQTVLEPAPNQTSPNPEVDSPPEQSGSQPDPASNPKPIDSNNQTDLNPGPNNVEQSAPGVSKADEAETDTSPNTALSEVARSDKGLEIEHLPEELSDSDEEDSILKL